MFTWTSPAEPLISWKAGGSWSTWQPRYMLGWWEILHSESTCSCLQQESHLWSADQSWTHCFQMQRWSQKQQHAWEHQWEEWEQHCQQRRSRTWIQWLRDHQRCWEPGLRLNCPCNEQCAAQWGTPCHWWCALNLCCCPCPSGSETGVFCSPQTGVLHSEFHPWQHLEHKHWLAAMRE